MKSWTARHLDRGAREARLVRIEERRLPQSEEEDEEPEDDDDPECQQVPFFQSVLLGRRYDIAHLGRFCVSDDPVDWLYGLQSTASSWDWTASARCSRSSIASGARVPRDPRRRDNGKGSVPRCSTRCSARTGAASADDVASPRAPRRADTHRRPRRHVGELARLLDRVRTACRRGFGRGIALPPIPRSSR
jgi:hypothetical protein